MLTRRTSHAALALAAAFALSGCANVARSTEPGATPARALQHREQPRPRAPRAPRPHMMTPWEHVAALRSTSHGA
jgi:hypothetical protein